MKPMKFLTCLALGLVLACPAPAADRLPKIYNTNATSCTIAATFMAGGVNQATNLRQLSISWTTSNPLKSDGTGGSVPGGAFKLTPAADGKSCTVQALQTGYSQVDVTCSYANMDLGGPTQTVTVVFAGQACDQVILTGSG